MGCALVTAQCKRRMSRSVSWSQSGTERGIPGEWLPAVIGSFSDGAVENLPPALVTPCELLQCPGPRGLALTSGLLCSRAWARDVPAGLTLLSTMGRKPCPWQLLPSAGPAFKPLQPLVPALLVTAGWAGTSSPSGDNALRGSKWPGTLQAVLPAQASATCLLGRAPGSTRQAGGGQGAPAQLLLALLQLSPVVTLPAQTMGQGHILGTAWHP